LPLRRSLDLWISGGLLALCAAAWPEIGDIRHPSYAQIAPALWTSVSLAVFTGLCALYVLRSIVRHRRGRGFEAGELPRQWYVNPLLSIVCFVLFLVAIPLLGMAVAGFLFVLSFLVLTGSRKSRALIFDGLLALVFVSAIHVLFTHVFGIILPTGALTGF
jgi:Tripartite tricarboxylate transporter TctB family